MNINQKNNFFKERREGIVIAFQNIFSFGFGEKKIEELLNLDWILEQVSKRSLEYAKYLVVGTISNIKEIDDIIKSKLKNWDIDRISQVDKAILRFSIFSLLHEKDLDAKVTINEAIEIAKIFGTEDSYKFINGILDAVKYSEKKKE